MLTAYAHTQEQVNDMFAIMTAGTENQDGLQIGCLIETTIETDELVKDHTGVFTEESIRRYLGE